jgi:hypothetical protein
MKRKSNDGLKAVLGYHQDHPMEFGHARHLIGHYNEIQTLEDLDKIYEELKEQGQLEASPNEVAVYEDKISGQRTVRTKFRLKSS